MTAATLNQYRIIFRKGRATHTWERFAATTEEARVSAERALDVEFSGKAKLIAVEAMTAPVQSGAALTPYEYGKAAFERGIRCAPAMDAEFLATRAGLPISSHRDGAYDEWLRGWTDANLAAPTPPAVTKEEETVATEPTTAPTEYQAAIAADDAWQTELERLFGRKAGDVRYTEEGRAGPTLAPLYAEFRRTSDVLHAKMNEQAGLTYAVQLCTCPRCGHPAQHEAAPNGEAYITCGHCGALTFARTADDEPASEFYAAAQAPTDTLSVLEVEEPGCWCRGEGCFYCEHPQLAPAPITMDEAVERAYAQRHVPLVDEERYTQPREVSDEEAIRVGALAMLATGIVACTACGGRHHPTQCPQVGALLTAPTPTPLSPVEALRLALERGVFGLDTKARLMAALEAADEEALMNAELLTRARESVAVNLEMRKIEAAIFDLPC